MSKIFLLIIIAIICFNSFLFSANTIYYVNDSITNNDVWCTTNGNDTHNGLSAGFPKRTITNLISTYSLGSNDIIYVDTGTYTEGVFMTNTSGKPNGCIKFIGAGISNKISHLTGLGGSGAPFRIESSKYIKINGFRLKSSPYLDYGILVDNSKFIVCTNNIIISNGHGGIRFNYVTNSLIINNDIMYNFRTANGWGIIINQGLSNQIISNICVNNDECGIIIENDSFYTVVDNNTISNHNKVMNQSAGIRILGVSTAYNYMNNNTIIRNEIGIHLSGTRYNFIKNNRLIRNQSGVGEGVGIKLNNTDQCFMTNNYLNQNYRSIQIIESSNCIAYSNQCLASRDFGFWLYNSLHNIIQNNYCTEGGWGPIILTFVDDCVVKNNQCFRNTGSPDRGGIKIENECRNIRIISNICASNSNGIIARYWNTGVFNNISSSTIAYNICYDNDEYNSSAGVSLWHGHSNLVFNNECYNNSIGLLIYTNSSYNTIKSNQLFENQRGLILTNTDYITLIGNNIRNNNGHGVDGFSASNTWVMNNIIRSNLGVGIYSRKNTESIMIQGNQIYNNYRGIYFYDSSTGSIFKNIIYRNNEGAVGYGIWAGASSSALIKNNTIFGHRTYGLYLDAVQSISNIITASNATGVGNTSAGQVIYNSCIFDGISGSGSLDSSCITSDPMFRNTTYLNEDFHLRYNSPCIGTGASNVVAPCMGSYTGYNIVENYSLGVYPHTIYWSTAYSNGSIPADGKIIINFPAGAFDLSTVTQVTSSSRWGGTKGGFSFAVAGQQITVTRDGTGTSSKSGETENLIISSISNIITGTGYNVIINTKTSDNQNIENLVSNDFAVGTPSMELNKDVNVTITGNPNPAIPGSTLTYIIYCSNVGIGTLVQPIIIDQLPDDISYITNSHSNNSGWTVEWSTNLNPDFDYNSNDFTNVHPAVSAIRWVRWKRPLLDRNKGSQFMQFKAVID